VLAPHEPAVVEGDRLYCCAGCVDATGCTCRRRAVVTGPPTERPFRFILDRAIPLEAHLNDWLS
jgi:hypothetical protein